VCNHMAGQSIPVNLERDLRQALEVITSPSGLSASPCISTCLVQEKLREQRQTPSREILQDILTDTLNRLKEHQPENADLLHGRFWEGLTPTEMVAKQRPKAWSERTFYKRQKHAIEEFVHLFWEQEYACQSDQEARRKVNPQQDEEGVSPPVPPTSTEAVTLPLITSDTEPPQNPPTPAEPSSSGDEVSPGNVEPTTRWGSVPRWRIMAAATLISLVLLVVAFAIFLSNNTPTQPNNGSPTSLAAVDSSPTPINEVSPETGGANTEVAPSATSAGGTAVAIATVSPTVRPVCGEPKRSKPENAATFLRHQGVSSYTVESSSEVVLNNKVRSLAIDSRGLWIGYFATDQNSKNGVGQFNRESWADCGVPGEGQGKNINALRIDSKGNVWAAAEKGGVLMFDGTKWNSYTMQDGLPTNESFGLTIDKDDNVWVGTWHGVARFDGKEWTVPYSEGHGTIYNNHVHAIAFDAEGNIWVGHVGRGVSQYSNADGNWINHRAEKGTVGGDIIFAITVRKATDTSPESVWFATSNGVSKYEDGSWRTYGTSDGLPSNEVNAVAVDPYNRVWVATAGGVAYLEEQSWVIYNTIPTLSIAFGPPCSGCPYDSDHIWTGTESFGLTHSRVPYPNNEQVIDVISVRYQKVDTSNEPFRDEIVVAPGEEFLAEIVVSPRSPYTLVNDAQTRGDFLSIIEESDDKRYGAYVQMAVTGTVASGQRFTFIDRDNPFKAPQLPDGVEEQKFVSKWRVWMYTRYVGPVIEVAFTVRRPPNTPNAVLCCNLSPSTAGWVQGTVKGEVRSQVRFISTVLGVLPDQ
jgi:hypothetical protein